MTPETDVKQRLAVLYATLAEATKACPCSEHKLYQDHSPCLDLDGGHGKLLCDGTGQVARFPGFREYKGRRWLIRAGGMADALAGLSLHEQVRGALVLYRWFVEHDNDNPAATSDEIDAEGLRLVCEITGLEVADAQS